MDINYHSWTGFPDALKMRAEGVYIVDNEDDYRSHCLRYQPNTIQLPDEVTDIPVKEWTELLGFNFAKVVFDLRSKYTMGFVRNAMRTVSPPPIFVQQDEDQIPAYVWHAQRLIKGTENAKKLLDDAWQFQHKAITPTEMKLIALDFLPVIRDHLELTNDELLEYYKNWEHQVKLKTGETLIRQACREAEALCDAGKPEAAQNIILKSYHENNQIQKGRKRVIPTMGEAWPGFLERIKKYRGRPIIGFATEMKMLTECLLGLRGLILLAAETNLGKTILAMQLAVEALIKQPDACCVFLSLEMKEDALWARISAALLNCTWADFVTAGTDEKAARATTLIQSFKDRLVLVDREDLDKGEDEILRLIQELQQRTGCKRVLAVIDYIQVWDVPEDKERMFKTDLDVDRWRIEAMRRVRNSLQDDDAIIVVSEVRKGKQDRERITPDDIMGSTRLAYAPDTILLWQKLTKAEKYQWIIPMGGGISGRRLANQLPKGKDAADEINEWAKAVDDICDSMNARPGWIQIAKGRDGTRRRDIPITAYYNQLTIEEGFFNERDVRKTKKEEVTDDNSIESIFNVE